MSTLQTIASSDTLNPTSLSKITTNFSTLNTDKLEAADIAGKQATLVSWTNIKTINSVTVLGSGDITIPALTDWDKGDITVSASGTVWNIDNSVVTNAKQANVATSTLKGRVTAATGVVEDLTGTQATTLLDTATTSLKGLMSSTDKTKLDGLPSSWSYINLTQVSNTGSVQEVLYTTTLPANTLGANGVVEWEIFFSNITTANSARSVNIEIYFWWTATSFQINASSTNIYTLWGIVKFRISGNGSTSSQKVEIISALSYANYYGWSLPPPTGLYASTSQTINTTSNQTIEIRTNPSGSSVTRTADSVVIRKII